MMQIDLANNPQLAEALFQRIKTEMTETMLANFALEMMINTLTQEKTALETRVSDLLEANTNLHNTVKTLRGELEQHVRPERASAKKGN